MNKSSKNGKSTDQFRDIQIVVLDDQGEEEVIPSNRLPKILADLLRKGVKNFHDVFDGRWKPEDKRILVREEDLGRVNSNTKSLLNMARGQRSDRVEMALSTLITQYHAKMKMPAFEEANSEMQTVDQNA